MRWPLALVALLVAGCVSPGDPAGPPATPEPTPPSGAPASFEPTCEARVPHVDVLLFRVSPPLPRVGDVASVSVDLQNPWSERRSGAIAVCVDGREAGRATFDLAPGERATTAADVRFDVPGARFVTAGLLSREVDVIVPLGLPSLDDPLDLGEPAEKRPWADPDGVSGDYLWFDGARSRVLERVIHGTRVVVAVHEDWLGRSEIGGFETRSPEAFAELVFDAFHRFWHVHEGFPHAEVRVVVKAPDDPCAFWTATPVGYPVCAGDTATVAGDATRRPHPLTVAAIPELDAHELFHLWNAGAYPAVARDVEGFPEEAWFVEGVTTYSSARALANASSLAGYERVMQKALDDYARLFPTAGGLSFPELAARTPPPREASPFTDMLYARGALVAYALDKELTARGSSLDALLAALYRERGLAGEAWSNEDLVRLASEVAGADVAPFFARYVTGGETLPPRVDWIDREDAKERPAVGIREVAIGAA